MPFPDSPKVIYKKNTIDRVICQLRFPPLLKIDSELPATFQERIRADFPDFHEREEPSIKIPQEIRQGLPAKVVRYVMPVQTKNYEFSSENHTINLTRTFIALTSKEYRRRSEFREKLKGPLQALIELYEPAYFTRVGLRYIDIIDRKELGLENIDWSELLQPYVLGLLSSDMRGSVESLEAKYEIRLDDGSSVARIVTGLVDVEDRAETNFMIDMDFYSTQKMTPTSAEEKLDYFHVEASKAFRWMITDELHNAMEPEDAE
ncbi:MAG: TIGR04255 family protein [Desulfobacteraceae bacterium]|nr:TIGR04255 family protein [Desulfobacteraceae bacterium]